MASTSTTLQIRAPALWNQISKMSNIQMKIKMILQF